MAKKKHGNDPCLFHCIYYDRKYYCAVVVVAVVAVVVALTCMSEEVLVTTGTFVVEVVTVV